MNIAIASIIAAQGLAIIVMAIRISGRRADAIEADNARVIAEEHLKKLNSEYEEHRNLNTKHLNALRDDIESLEKDLDNCVTPGSRRRRLELLLSKVEKA